ncbi:hypothetical protein Trydic_g9119 [Trypoxylus dichotomus]
MDAEGAAALPPEEYDSGICVNALSTDSTKAKDSPPTEIVGVAESATEQGLDQAAGIATHAISEPNLSQTAESLDLSKHESCELGGSRAGAADENDESEKSEKEDIPKDDLREDPSIEDSLGNLTTEDVHVNNENEEGKLRRQNASHRLVEGVRIPSESSSEQP